MKILVAVSRFPWPPRRGDQLRTVQTIDFLAEAHEVTLVAPEPPPGVTAPTDLPCELVTYRTGGRAAVASGLARAGARGLPLQSGLYFQPDLGERLRSLAPRVDLGLLQLVRLAIHYRDFGDTPFVVDLVDSLSLNFSRRAQLDRLWLRPALRLEARLLSIWEHRLLEHAARGILVCERDRMALSRRRLLAPEAARRLSVVPLAVRERHPPPGAPAADPARPVLAITGNLGYFVNEDAVRWFLRRVWPALRRQIPGVRLVVAGDRPAPGLARRISAAGAELVTSPPDLRALIAGASVSLAPMRGGSGLPIKILEAWSVGTPVVASPWAAAGTSGGAGEDFLVAREPGEWVQAIVTLLADADLRARIVANGRARLAAGYSRRVVRSALLDLVARVGSELSPARARVAL